MATSTNQPVASLSSCVLYAEDVATLAPGAWLNDAVLSFACEALEQRLSAAAPGLRCLHPPAVQLLLHETDADDLAGFAAGLRLASADLALLPINNSADVTQPATGSHWSLLAWRRGLGFAHLDSSPGSANAAVAARVAAKLAPLLPPGGGMGDAGALAVRQLPCPVQRNFADCGAHVAWATERLAAARAREAAGEAPLWSAVVVALQPDAAAEAELREYRERLRALAREHRYPPPLPPP